MIAAITIQRTIHSSMWKNGNTWVATCTGSHAPAAYSVAARSTLRRLSSAKKLMADYSQT